MAQIATYCGFPHNENGRVIGHLPPGLEGIEHSSKIEAAGYEVHVERNDELHDDNCELDADALTAWQPEPPTGEGWTLAWKADDEDGCNVVFWREKRAAAA